MKEGLIGVIVPVYKVEKYIAECIESILAQTYTNFRLILVDDGTPDNAGKICDEYAKKDSRITVIHQENAGVTRARARGVEEAEDCEWITFVDGDDTLPIDALTRLMAQVNSEADIILGYRTEINNGIERAVLNNIGSGRYNSIDYINAMLIDDCAIGPWAKIIKRKLFSKETLNIPREVVQFEDIYMNIALACNANSIYIDNNTHTYRHREISETSQVHRNGYMKEDGWYILLSSIKAILNSNKILEKVSLNFSRFAYIRICACMNYHKCRFKSCKQLQIETHNKMQKSVVKVNHNELSYFLYTIKRKVKTLLKK